MVSSMRRTRQLIVRGDGVPVHQGHLSLGLTVVVTAVVVAFIAVTAPGFDAAPGPSASTVSPPSEAVVVGPAVQQTIHDTIDDLPATDLADDGPAFQQAIERAIDDLAATDLAADGPAFQLAVLAEVAALDRGN